MYPDKTRRKGTIRKSDGGRYFRSKIPSGKINDIAFDATIRAAALTGFQSKVILQYIFRIFV